MGTIRAVFESWTLQVMEDTYRSLCEQRCISCTQTPTRSYFLRMSKTTMVLVNDFKKSAFNNYDLITSFGMYLITSFVALQPFHTWIQPVFSLSMLWNMTACARTLNPWSHSTKYVSNVYLSAMYQQCSSYESAMHQKLCTTLIHHICIKPNISYAPPLIHKLCTRYFTDMVH